MSLAARLGSATDAVWLCVYIMIHVGCVILIMNKEIEGAVEGVKSFYGESRRFLEVCEKPDVAGT